MVFKGLIAATVAVTLSAAPAIAASNAPTTQLAPAAESVDGSQAMSASNWLIALLALLAAIGGVVALTDNNDAPQSP